MNQQEFNAKLKRAASDEERISLLDSYGEELFEKEDYPGAINVYSQALKIMLESPILFHKLVYSGFSRVSKGGMSQVVGIGNGFTQILV